MTVAVMAIDYVGCFIVAIGSTNPGPHMALCFGAVFGDAIILFAYRYYFKKERNSGSKCR